MSVPMTYCLKAEILDGKFVHLRLLLRPSHAMEKYKQHQANHSCFVLEASRSD